MVNDSDATYKEIDGFKVPRTVAPAFYYSAVKYKPRKGDVIVASYPKCGTTWLIQIVLLILRKGVPPRTADEYFSSTPFLEMVGAESTKKMSKPGCIKTHLPFDKLKFSDDPDVKYLYVTRHPADCVISYFYHVQYFPTYYASKRTFDEIFQDFIEGKLIYEDYFDHLLSWYPHRDKPNVFFVTFEELKADTRNVVLKIAKFLGNEHFDSLISNEEKILKDVLQYSSIDYMKCTINTFYKERFVTLLPFTDPRVTLSLEYYQRVLRDALKEGHSSKGDFIRKGVSNETKALSESQRNILATYIRQKTTGSDVMSLWKKKVI